MVENLQVIKGDLFKKIQSALANGYIMLSHHFIFSVM